MKAWRGIPREEIPWYPTINQDLCAGCRTCFYYCKENVLGFDKEARKTRVVNPYNCYVECRACAKLCPRYAISLPDQAAFSEFIKERGVRQARN